MQLQKTKKGFTLIELLVVITIIGILATGATTVYTSQIQKARDTNRLNDLVALRSGIEQTYQDNGTYPNAGLKVDGYAESFKSVTTYTPKLPKDPKTGQKATNTNFDYTYGVAADENGIGYQTYELSTTFENKGTRDTKAKTDGGDDENRLEFGINISSVKTLINLSTPPTSWVDNSEPTSNSCITVAGSSSTSCSTSANSNTENASTLVIR